MKNSGSKQKNHCSSSVYARAIKKIIFWNISSSHIHSFLHPLCQLLKIRKKMHLSFEDWLNSVSMMFSSFTSFLFFFFPFFGERQDFILVYSGVILYGVYMYDYSLIRLLIFDKFLELRIVGSYGVPILRFLWNLHTVFCCVCIRLHTHKQYIHCFGVFGCQLF